MKTIFDLLSSSQFRKRPAMFIGDNDLRTLETWIQGYISACDDAGTYDCLKSKYGVDIRDFRDYIAYWENLSNARGFAALLKELSHCQTDEAWKLFFEYLDRFSELKIVKQQRLELTDQRKEYAQNWLSLITVHIISPEGDIIQREPRFTEIHKTMFSEGICRLDIIGDNFYPSDPFFPSNIFHTEEEVDEELLRIFGDIEWETI